MFRSSGFIFRKVFIPSSPIQKRDPSAAINLDVYSSQPRQPQRHSLIHYFKFAPSNLYLADRHRHILRGRRETLKDLPSLQSPKDLGP